MSEIISIVGIITAVSLILGGYVMCGIKDNTDTSIGFRTEKSLKSNETWLFANHLCGKIWIVTGISSLVSIIISMFLTDVLSFIVFALQTFMLIFSAVYVEIKLKDNFDENGRYKDK